MYNTTVIIKVIVKRHVFCATPLSGRRKYCGSPHKVKCIYLLKDWSADKQLRLAHSMAHVPLVTKSHFTYSGLQLQFGRETTLYVHKYGMYSAAYEYVWLCVCAQLAVKLAQDCGSWMRCKLFMTLTLNYDCNNNASWRSVFYELTVSALFFAPVLLATRL